MPNLTKVLNDEIRRLARKEVKLAAVPLKHDTVRLKKTVAEMKRQLASLEKASRELADAAGAAAPAASAEGDEEAGKFRITAKGVRSMRRKLGLTREDFARLCDATAQSVYNWERKEGALALRGTSRAALAAMRGMGARAARAKLAEMKD